MANLSAEGVEIVIQLEHKEGRQYLRRLLEWKEFDEIRDLQRSNLLDVYYNSLVFAAEKGFPWPAVAEIGRLTAELLDDTKGLPISQAVQILEKKLSALPVKLAPFKLQAVCDYFHNTFIKHYWLYQSLLVRERDRHQQFASFEVHAPPTPLPLMEGTDIEVWRYQQKVADLTAAEDQKRASILLLQQTLHQEREWMLQKVYSTVQKQAEVLGTEELESLVKEVIRNQVLSLHNIFQNEIQATFDILQLRLQKKALMLNPPAPYPPSPVTDDRGKKKSEDKGKALKTQEKETKGGKKGKKKK